MTVTESLPGSEELKAFARRLRREAETRGETLTHSGALERVAHELGHRDWNTLAAAVHRQSSLRDLTLNARVRGAYLGQRFEGKVVGMSARGAGLRQISIALDTPIDVVESKLFSSWRHRVSGVIGPNGETSQRISSGEPHLRVTPI